jgi:hypothetical protein
LPSRSLAVWFIPRRHNNPGPFGFCSTDRQLRQPGIFGHTKISREASLLCRSAERPFLRRTMGPRLPSASFVGSDPITADRAPASPTAPRQVPKKAKVAFWNATTFTMTGIIGNHSGPRCRERRAVKSGDAGCAAGRRTGIGPADASGICRRGKRIAGDRGTLRWQSSCPGRCQGTRGAAGLHQRIDRTGQGIGIGTSRHRSVGRARLRGNSRDQFKIAATVSPAPPPQV